MFLTLLASHTLGSTFVTGCSGLFELDDAPAGPFDLVRCLSPPAGADEPVAPYDCRDELVSAIIAVLSCK